MPASTEWETKDRHLVRDDQKTVSTGEMIVMVIGIVMVIVMVIVARGVIQQQ